MQDVFGRDDEFTIPDPGYQVPRRRPAQNSNRRLAIIATTLGVALVGIGGGLEFASHRSGGVPVISADSRPLRVKPENPGGMQVIGANESLAESGGGNESLAPPPEAPDPKALQVQQQADAARTSAAVAAASMPSAAMLARTGSAAPDVPLPPQSGDVASAAKPAAVASLARPAPVAAPVHPAANLAPVKTPVAAPRVAAATPATISPQWSAAESTTASPAPAAAESGRKIVQLAAVGSQEAATAEWDRLSKRMPDLLSGRHPEIVRYEHDGKTFFRLRTAGFASSADADAFCGKVKTKGANCAVF